MPNSPIVSIITITKNPHMPWLRQALESIAKQTYREIESIVIDASDAPISTEISRLARQISQNHNRVIKYFQQRSTGLWPAFTEGFELATGSILGVLNSDDYLNDSLAIADLADIFATRNFDFVFGNSQRVDSDGENIYLHRPPRPLNSISVDYYVFSVSHHTLYFRKRLLQRIPFTGNNDQAPPDLSFIRELFKQGASGSYVNRTIGRFRIHENNYSGSYSASSIPKLFSIWTGLPSWLYLPFKLYVSAWSPGYLRYLLKRAFFSNQSN